MKLNTIALSLTASALMLATPAQHAEAQDSEERLKEVLNSQGHQVTTRYGARNPHKTLGFFGVEPGMTVMEGLPGGGWYSKILLDYLGPEGTLIGADYAEDMFPLFGFFNDDQLAAKATWVEDWTEQASGWVKDGAAVQAFQFGSMPESMNGQADMVLMIRAMHNLARFEDQGGYLTAALQDMYDVLRPGGIVGIVQHEARPDMSDDFADGSRGYLKKSFVIERMEAAGFEFVAETDVNQNEKDQPGEEDIVWRLPPSLSGVRDNPRARAASLAIGESNRMTLKFRKPE